MYIVNGINITIVYNVTGEVPPITIRWLNNQQPVHSSDNMTTLTVSNATDGDVITCIAKNREGSDIKQTYIKLVNKYFCIND